MPRRPFGFMALAVCAGGFGVLMAMLLSDFAATDPPDLTRRAAVAATGALAFVTAEALLCARPWAYGASLAFAGSYAAMLVVYGLGDGSLAGAVGAVLFSAVFLLPVLGYVRLRSRQLNSRVRPHAGSLPPVAP